MMPTVFFLLFFLLIPCETLALIFRHPGHAARQRRPNLPCALRASGTGEVGSGPNWIERSFPVDTDESSKVDPKTVIDYDLGISGQSYQTGSLSKRMFEAIEARSSLIQGASMEVKRGFLIFTMDATAKEAVKAALKRNGLELVLSSDEEDEGMWADIDSIRLLDEDGLPISGNLYDSWEEAVDEWAPGRGFDFVARQVPAKMKELSLGELLQALDPDGELREQAKSAGMHLPDENINTLKEMADENIRRTEMTPREAVAESDAFAGIPEQRGYHVVKASELTRESRDADGTEKENILMHVMDGLANHGCLIVDLTDGGSNFEKAQTVASMWSTAEDFFGKPLDLRTSEIPPMKTIAKEAGSPHAKVGFASYHDGDMQFLETRLDRQGRLFPEEAQSVLSVEGCKALQQSFKIISDVGKDIVRIAVGASTRETGALSGADASQAAILLANEVLDDGESVAASLPAGFPFIEGSVSMSPHRLCRYSNNQAAKNKTQDLYDNTREIFGAHTDSTFVTAVPVASVSGLEVYDEGAGEWYRPEVAARQHWVIEQASQGHDSDDWTDKTGTGDTPWHARYVVFMAGELLQLFCRNEIMASVHRVVATTNSAFRLSAPVLLRGRPGVQFSAERYLGALTESDTILKECESMTIEQIHDAMQPTSFQ